MSVICGDSLHVLPTLDAESVDAIVCDPPYGLSFMGKDWDHGVPGEAFWREALRVAKPGAHLVAFGGTRTYHRLAVAIEDAGWEIRDCLSWLYGSGFPKSHDVSKAMDKAAGVTREVVGIDDEWIKRTGYSAGGNTYTTNTFGSASGPNAGNITAPATDLARQWQGWGTALKPGWEPVILARKPLIGTVAANVAQYGTGGINVDGCRIGTSKPVATNTAFNSWRNLEGRADRQQPEQTYDPNSGRWPANVVLDEEAAGMLDAQTGTLTSGANPTRRASGMGYHGAEGQAQCDAPRGVDSGGASRFFYTAKASRKEREAGLEGMPEREYPVAVIQTQGVGLAGESLNGKQVARSRNFHPTVKPIALMRWLCRLVTPKGGLILDPFTGSGTTGCAAVLEGFRFVGVEREPEYAAIAEKRIAHWAAQTPDADLFTEAL
jgi:site-specific DNA-methyltransferase (adenine-specific)